MNFGAFGAFGGNNFFNWSFVLIDNLPKGLEFCRPETFDVVLNLFSTFGYFESPEDDRRVVENACNSLKSGGKFILEMLGKEILARDFRKRDWYKVDDDLVLEERKISDDWGKIRNRWIIFKNDQRIEHTITLRLYSAVELSSLLKECGFSQVTVFGDLQGSEYDDTAKRLVVMGQK